MAEVVLSDVTKRFRHVTAVDAMDLDHRRRRVRRAPRPDRRRQDHDASPRRRPRAARRGTDRDRRPRRHRARAGGARRRLRLPAILALSASDAPTTISPSRCARRRGACRRPRSRSGSRRSRRCLRIAGKLQNRATQLSGGEMQRVAIGRALVRRPSIYLMDEPLSSLDAKLRADLRLELKRIQAELGATILYVTHDQTEAMTMANRIGVIEKGRLIQVGTPRADLHRPAQRLCRDTARPAGDQPDSGRAGAERRAARRRKDGRRPHRAFPHRQGGERQRRSARSTGSSISATRTISMSASAATRS